MEKKNIYETITAVMEEIGAIGKNSKNNQQNFMYRGIDAVMNALSPAFVKHRLFIRRIRMQNIEAILTELGIEVPADKKENLTKKVAENYITKAEHF